MRADRDTARVVRAARPHEDATTLPPPLQQPQTSPSFEHRSARQLSAQDGLLFADLQPQRTVSWPPTSCRSRWFRPCLKVAAVPRALGRSPEQCMEGRSRGARTAGCGSSPLRVLPERMTALEIMPPKECLPAIRPASDRQLRQNRPVGKA